VLLLVVAGGALVVLGAAWRVRLRHGRASPQRKQTPLAAVDKRQIISTLLNIHTFNRRALEISSPFFLFVATLANQSLLF
jgi:hypothetical protein